MSLLALAATVSALAPPAAELPLSDEIVVTGRRDSGAQRVEPDAVEILRAFCFDPARRAGRFEPPPADSRWFELDEQERRQFRIRDAAVPAYALEDATRDHHVWLKLERFSGPAALDEKRCTLLVIGGRDHDRFVAAMSKLFRGSPTQRHVGVRDGSPALPNWEQWLWTGMPSRGSKAWTSIQHPRGAPPTWLVVSDVGRFYDSYDYIVGEMKLRRGGRAPMTMLTFSVSTRQRR